MKKYLFALTAAAVALLSSCAKEEAPATVESTPGTFTITARIDNDATKTHYVEGTSSAALFWNAGDRFKLMIYKNDEGKASNFYSFEADADAAGSEATFSIVAGSMDLTTYTPAGYAVYPNTLGTSGVKDAYTVTLSGEYTVASGSDLSKVSVPMIGVPTDAADANTYVFTPAVGVLKVQLSNVPADACKVVLKAVDSDNLSGVFPLDAVNGFRMADATNAGHTVTVNFPAQAEGSDLAIYMPVPVGTISAGAVLEVQDNSGVALHTTPATVKAINVEKGQLIPIKAFSIDWKTLGTGKFVDNFLWASMGVATSTTDEVGYIDVTIQQNNVNPAKYRLVNPYASILAKLGKTQDASHNDFLEFTIADANTVNFVTTNTGYDSGSGIVRLEDLGGTNNKVFLGTADDPKIIQLAPKYGSNGTFAYTRSGRDNMIRIAFPGVYEQHCASVSIGKSDLSTGVDFTSTAFKTTIYVSSSPLYSFYTSYDAQLLPTTCSSSWDPSGNKTSANMGVASALTTSGPQYVFWTTFVEDGKTILFQGCKRFYFLTSVDAAAIAGNWTHDTSDGCQLSGNVPSTANFTLAVSTSPATSNVMVTQFDGLDCTYPVQGVFTTASGKIELSNYVYFDDYSHYFARTSSESTHLNLVFTDNTKAAFYADHNFGLKNPSWVYYYTANSSHLYTK